MDSYLMMLYVTLEQESALKNFFIGQGWEFCKPDLTVTTDTLGPSLQGDQTFNQSSNISIRHTQKGKRKGRLKQSAPVVKMAKIVPSESELIVSSVNQKHTVACVQSDAKMPKELKDKECLDTGNINSDSALPVNQINSDIKEETFDLIENPDGYDNNDENDDEDTDVDYNFEEGEDSDVKTDENETGNSLRDVSVNEVKNEDDDTEEHVIVETATEPKESKNVQGAKYGVRHHHSYTQAQIDSALHYYMEQEIQGKKVSMRKLADMFSVPMTTLFNHIRSASGKLQKRIICEICGHSFLYQHQLKQHMKKQHEGHVTTYRCHLCTKSFLFRSRLQHHLNMHNDMRPYVCKNMCGKSYFSPQSRYSHELQCQKNQPRPFQCTKCGLSFKVQSALNRHIAAKHGAPKYSCECGQAFGWSQSLNRHRKTCKKVQKAISDENELQTVVKTIQDTSVTLENEPVSVEYVYIHP